MPGSETMGEGRETTTYKVSEGSDQTTAKLRERDL